MPQLRLSASFLAAAMAVVLGLGATGVQAQSRPAAPVLVGSGPSWAELSPAQRDALAPLQQEWPRIDAQRRAKWLEIASRFPSMPVDERQRVQGRMAEWAKLSPAERGRARVTYQEAKQLPAEERQARWEAYRALPPEQREALASRGAASAERNAPAAKRAPADSTKRNIVGNPVFAAPPGKPVAPTVVQAGPGATTTLLTQQGKPPVHQQPGLPKVAATQGFVDNKTLLPRRGAQGAATPVANGGSAPRGRP